MTAAPFTPDVVAAVTAHMNGDHADDNVLIVRALGGVPDATSAEMIGCDETGIHFVAATPAGPSSVTVPWGTPIEDRAGIRLEVVRMYHEACTALGVEPRQAEEH